MKKWITGAALAAMITVPANAQPRRGNRQVQMIAMGGASEPTGLGARSEAGVPAGISSPPEIPGFAVHDLSRRYVESVSYTHLTLPTNREV